MTSASAVISIWWMMQTEVQGSPSSYRVRIYISPHGPDGVSYLQARRGDDSGTTELQLRTWHEGELTEAVRIDGNGNVGIGSTEPKTRGSYKLTAQ